MTSAGPATVLTIGHGLMALHGLIANLTRHNISFVMDVRSAPGSARAPQFNRVPLSSALSRAGIEYGWSEALGGRPASDLLTASGAPDYEKMIDQPATREALENLCLLAESHRVVLLCSESRPEDCHRSRMLEPALEMRGIRVDHILPDGELTTQPTLFG